MKFAEFSKELDKVLAKYGFIAPVSETDKHQIWAVFNDSGEDDLFYYAYTIACDLNAGFSLDESMQSIHLV